MEAAPGAVAVREFLKTLPPAHALTAAFDTRADIPELLSGSAARAIGRRLARKHLRSITDPQSFLVVGPSLVEGEIEHARHLGEAIVSRAEHVRALRPDPVATG